MRYLYILFIVFFSSICVFAQSPWVAGKGKGYAQLGFSGIGPYSKLFSDGNDSYTLVREVSDRTIQLYGEYGITEKTSLLAVAPIKMLRTGELVEDAPQFDDPIEAGTFTTMGNFQLAVRQNLINNGFVLSGQLLLELPTGGFDEHTGLRGGLDAITIAPSFSIGAGKENIYGFLSTGVGIRTNNYSSDLKIGGELGYQVLKRIYFIVVLDVVKNFENGEPEEEESNLQTGLYLNNQSYFAYGFKTIIGFTDSIGLTGAYYGAGGGNLVARSPSLNVGLYYKW